MRVLCPHCDTEATIRSSQQMGATVRELRMQCNNLECAHTWIAWVMAVRTISPSMTPNKTVQIPISPRSEAVRTHPPQGVLDLGEFRPRAMDSG